MVSSIRPTPNHVLQTGEPVSVHYFPTNVPLATIPNHVFPTGERSPIQVHFHPIKVPLPPTPNHVMLPGEPVSVHVILKSTVPCCAIPISRKIEFGD